MEYNGFKNKETWIVSLWLNNTESTATYWSNVAREQAERLPYIDAVQYVADRLKMAHEQFACDSMHDANVNGCFSDLLLWALDDVDWDHIAQNLVDGVTVES
jgi:hypothetical protein